MDQRLAGPGRTRLFEAAVIVLSILAAFAIDAWWDASQQKTRARAEIASLRSEFDAVDRELVRAATFGMLFTRSRTISDVALPTGALTNLLASGDLNILGDLELQNQLASWPSIASLMAVKFSNLVINRDANVLPVAMQLIGFSASFSAGFHQAWPDDHQFPFDSKPLLASREFENLMSGRWITIQIAGLTVADAQKVTRTIRTALDDWR